MHDTFDMQRAIADDQRALALDRFNRGITVELETARAWSNAQLDQDAGIGGTDRLLVRAVRSGYIGAERLA